MPDLYDIRAEIHPTYRAVRRRYAQKIRDITGRNVIVYYSGWLQKPHASGTQIHDRDMSAFMSVIHGLRRKDGLDLILHTPGGDAAATEALVNYLRGMFHRNIRTIVPHLAMSAGTMIACAAKSVLMGKHSSLGPIDPQIGGLPAHGILREFERAYKEIKNDPKKIGLWRPIIAKYPPSLVEQCEHWVAWSSEMAKEWLATGMLVGRKDAKRKAADIVGKLGDTTQTKSHDRHLSAAYCRKIGMQVEMMEGKKNHALQDAVLSLHHACILTFEETRASKIIENHHGTGIIQAIAKKQE